MKFIKLKNAPYDFIVKPMSKYKKVEFVSQVEQKLDSQTGIVLIDNQVKTGDSFNRFSITFIDQGNLSKNFKIEPELRGKIKKYVDNIT